MLEHFGYEDMQRGVEGLEAELYTAETDNGDVPLMLFARARRTLLEAQQQGAYRTRTTQPLCDSCLTDFIDT